jgi:heme/copper-type cytochrome/quinol oxidase subunit 2
MVHAAILCVLILIAVLMAPSLLLAIAAAAALYGAYIVAAATILVVATVVAICWVLVSSAIKRSGNQPEQIHGARKSCRNCQIEMAATATHCNNCGS